MFLRVLSVAVLVIATGVQAQLLGSLQDASLAFDRDFNAGSDMAAYFTPDAVLLVNGSTPIVGAANVAGNLSVWQHANHAVTQQLVAGEYVTVANVHGQPEAFSRAQYSVSPTGEAGVIAATWVRVDGNWLISTQHWLPNHPGSSSLALGQPVGSTKSLPEDGPLPASCGKVLVDLLPLMQEIFAAHNWTRIGDTYSEDAFWNSVGFGVEIGRPSIQKFLSAVPLSFKLTAISCGPDLGTDNPDRMWVVTRSQGETPYGPYDFHILSIYDNYGEAPGATGWRIKQECGSNM